MCVCACVCACVRACVRACVCVRGWGLCGLRRWVPCDGRGVQGIKERSVAVKNLAYRVERLSGEEGERVLVRRVKRSWLGE